MRRVGLLACLSCLIAAAAPAPQSKTARPPAKAPATSAQKSAAKKAPTPSKASKTSKKRPAPGKKSKSKKRLPSWRYGQQVPTRERYLEIQEALISRGFLAGPPTGIWGSDDVEALKKFQASQNLEPSGKLDSLTLIALGLGPKRASNGALPRPTIPSEPKQP